MSHTNHPVGHAQYVKGLLLGHDAGGEMDVVEDVGRIVRDGNGQSLERLVNVTDSRAFDGGVAGCSRARRCREITVLCIFSASVYDDGGCGH